MHETKEYVCKLGAMKKTLVAAMEAELGKGVDNVCTEEAGAVVDMIKDLSESIKDCWKACYYKKIVEAMEEAKEEDEVLMKLYSRELEKASAEELRSLVSNSRMGYDNWRYSSGRFAPKGHGRDVGHGGRMGYITPMDPTLMDDPMSPYRNHPVPPVLGRMGYPDESYNGDMRDDGRTNESKTPHARYAEARRYFTATGTPESRDEMTKEAKHCLEESVSTMRDIWVDADPALQEQMKKDLLKLMREMGM